MILKMCSNEIKKHRIRKMDFQDPWMVSKADLGSERGHFHGSDSTSLIVHIYD
jgi:hypothetical protein